MQVRKTSIFVLSLLLSYEAFGANASIRAGALRLNQPQNSVSNTANKTTSEKLSINDTLSSYNRASSLRPNRVQVSGGGNKNPAVNEEVLNKVYEEMERVTSAVEQELYLTSREIKTLKDEIAEKDEKIKDLELALEDYEEMKETVKNIPNIYYSKKEVDSKGYVMPSTLSSAIETAKNTVKKEALAEVNSKGFITSSAVADEIAQAKNAAVSAAVAQVENMNFATANSVAAAETRMANAIDSAKATITNERNAALQLYAKTSDVTSEITLAKNTAIADAKTQTIAAIEDKNYATQQFVNTELSNLDLGIDEAAVGTIIENKLLAKDYATKSFAENKASAALNEAKSYTNTSVNNETTSRQAAINTIDSRLSTYATRTEVDDMVEEAVNPESIATGLLNNNQFKTELVSAVNQDVSALSTRVGALEAEDTTINNRLATFSTKQELSGAVADINNTINNLELGIDENVVIGIIDDQIGKKKVLTESSNVFTAVKNTVDAIPDNYYSMSTVDKKIADAVTGGEIDLSGYLAKDELNSELKKISDTEICLTKDCIAGLDLGVDEDAVISIIGNQFSENKVLTENSTAFTDVKNTVDAIPDNYYSMSKVDQKIADAVTGGEIDLSGYLAKDELIGELKNISDTEICLTKNCAADFLENKGLLVDGKRPDFLEAESQEIVDIKEKVQLIPEYGMQCLSLECVNDRIEQNFIDKKVVKQDTLLSDIEGLNKFVKADDVNTMVTEAVDPDNIATNLLQNDKFKKDLTEAVNQDVSALSTRVDALEAEDTEINSKFALYTDTESMNSAIADAVAVETKARTDAGYLTNSSLTSYATKSFVGEEIAKETTARNSAISGLSDIYAAKSALDSYVLKSKLKDDIEGLNTFVTVGTVEDIVTEKVDPDNIATNLLQNDKFKKDLTEAVNQDVSALSTRVDALEAEDTEINSKFALYTDTESMNSAIADAVAVETKARTDAGYLTNATLTQGMLTTKLGNAYVTSDVMTNAIATAKSEAVSDAATARDTALASYAKTSDITKAKLTATLGDAYLTDASLNGYAKTDAMNSAIATAKSEAITAAVSDAATARTEALASYAKTSDMNTAIATAKSEAIDSAVADAATARDTALASYAKTSDMNTAIATAKSEAIDSAVADAATARDTALASYAKTSDMNTAIATAKSEAISQAATDRSAALADYVSNDGLNDAIASSKAITDMAADIQKNATAAAEASATASAAQSAADKASATADTASATASAAQTAAEAADAKAVAADAKAVAADAKAVAAADAASTAQTAANTVSDKIGDLSAFDTGKGVTVAQAITGVKSTADDAADAASAAQTAAGTAQQTVQDLGDQLCSGIENLQCEAGGFTPSQRQ